MRDRLFFPLLGLLAAGMVALALYWPQGSGAPSPAAFIHQTPPPPRVRQGQPGPSQTGAP